MSGLIVSRVEQKTINYSVQHQDTRKIIGWIKKDVMDGWQYQPEFQTVLNQKQVEELLRHLQELNKK